MEEFVGTSAFTYQIRLLAQLEHPIVLQLYPFWEQRDHLMNPLLWPTPHPHSGGHQRDLIDHGLVTTILGFRGRRNFIIHLANCAMLCIERKIVHHWLLSSNQFILRLFHVLRVWSKAHWIQWVLGLELVELQVLEMEMGLNYPFGYLFQPSPFDGGSFRMITYHRNLPGLVLSYTKATLHGSGSVNWFKASVNVQFKTTWYCQSHVKQL